MTAERTIQYRPITQRGRRPAVRPFETKVEAQPAPLHHALLVVGDDGLYISRVQVPLAVLVAPDKTWVDEDLAARVVQGVPAYQVERRVLGFEVETGDAVVRVAVDIGESLRRDVGTDATWFQTESEWAREVIADAIERVARA